MNSIDNDRYKHEQSRSFARQALVNYSLYLDLKSRERDERFIALLDALAHNAKEEFSFWATKSMVRGDEGEVGIVERFAHRLYRRVLGVPLMSELMISRERAKLRHFNAYCVDCMSVDERKATEAIIERSLALISLTDVHHTFYASVVHIVGLALFQTPAVLIAASMVFGEPRMVAMVSVIASIASAIALAATLVEVRTRSHEIDHDKSTLYGGIYALILSLLLLLPFVYSNSLQSSLAIAAALLLFAVSLFSFIASIIHGTSYLREFAIHIVRCIGAAMIAASLGYVLYTL